MALGAPLADFVPPVSARVTRFVQRWFLIGLTIAAFSTVVYMFSYGGARFVGAGLLVMGSILTLAFIYALVGLSLRMPPKLLSVKGGQVTLSRPVRSSRRDGEKISSIPSERIMRVDAATDGAEPFRFTFSDSSSLTVLKTHPTPNAILYLRSCGDPEE